MSRKWMLIALMLILAGLLAACGGNGGGGGAAPSAGTIRIVTQNIRFNPNTLTIKAGQKVTVELINKDRVPHTFEIEGVQGVGVGVPPGGEATLEFSIDKPGTYTIFCGVGSHRAQGMVGTLTVQP